MTLRQVDQLLLETAREADALPPLAWRQMAPVLAQARRETGEALTRWLRGVPDARARFTAQTYRTVMVQLDQALSTIAGLAPETVRGLEMANDRAAPLAVHHIQRELAEFARMFKGSHRPIPLREAAALADGGRSRMKRFESSARRYAGSIGEDIRRQLAVGMLRGESIDQMTARLIRGRVEREVGPGAQIAEELFIKYRGWGERLARTEVLAAYNDHTVHGITLASAEDPEVGRMWNAALDRRSCADCASLDGVFVAADERFPEGDPPLHPNCRCTVVAWRRDWKA